MKALVTGASGYIGMHLTKALLKKDYEVYCLVRKTSAVNELKSIGAKLIYGDITNTESLNTAVRDKEYIYHLAIARFPKYIKEYYLINHIGTENIINACSKFNPNVIKFAYVSSLAAAGFSPQATPLKETDTPHPVTDYGKSKLRGEESVLRYKDILPIVILRPPTVYGPGNLLLDSLLTLSKLRIKFSWPGYTSLCYINDLVNGLILAAENKKSDSQTYFICDNITYSWDQIIDSLSRQTKNKKLTIHINQATIKLASMIIPFLSQLIKKPYIGNKIIELKYPHWICDSTKIEKELSFCSKFNLEKGIRSWLSS